MNDAQLKKMLKAMQTICEVLEPLEPAARVRVLKAAAILLEIEIDE